MGKLILSEDRENSAVNIFFNKKRYITKEEGKIITTIYTTRDWIPIDERGTKKFSDVIVITHCPDKDSIDKILETDRNAKFYYNGIEFTYDEILKFL